jgi:hypothetical protein
MIYNQDVIIIHSSWHTKMTPEHQNYAYKMEVSLYVCTYLCASEYQLAFKQGDQIGRIFAQLVIVYFGQ